MTALKTIAVGLDTFCDVQNLIVHNIPALETITIPCGLKNVVHPTVPEEGKFREWLEEGKRKREEEKKKKKVEEEQAIRDCVESMLARVEQEVKKRNGIVENATEFQNLPPTQTLITVLRCSDYLYPELDFAKFQSLEKLDIGLDCFSCVKRLSLTNMPLLFSVRIDKFAFCQEEGEMIVASCPSLLSIRIGDHSFEHFASFLVRELRALKTIHIGKHCFRNGSFTVDSADSLTEIAIEEQSFERPDKVLIQGACSQRR